MSVAREVGSVRRQLVLAVALNAAGCLVVTPLDDVAPAGDAGEGATPAGSLPPGGASGAGAGASTSYECADPIEQWRAGQPYVATFQRQTGDCPQLPAVAFTFQDDSSCETTSARVLGGCGHEAVEVCAAEGLTSTTTLRQSAADGPIEGTFDLQVSSSDGDCASRYGVALAPAPDPYVCDPLVQFNGTFLTVVEVRENSCDVSPPAGGERTEDWRSNTWLSPDCALVTSSTEAMGCSYSATFECDEGGATVVVSQDVPGGLITAHWVDRFADGCVLDYSVEYFPS